MQTQRQGFIGKSVHPIGVQQPFLAKCGSVERRKLKKMVCPTLVAIFGLQVPGNAGHGDQQLGF